MKLHNMHLIIFYLHLALRIAQKYSVIFSVLLMGSHQASTEKCLQSIEIVVNGAAPLSASDADRLVARAKVSNSLLLT